MNYILSYNYFNLNRVEYSGTDITSISNDVLSEAGRDEFRPRQTRQLPRAVDLKGRLLSCQSY